MQFGSASANHGIQNNSGANKGGVKGAGNQSKSPNKKSSQITGQSLGI